MHIYFMKFIHKVSFSKYVFTLGQSYKLFVRLRIVWGLAISNFIYPSMVDIFLFVVLGYRCIFVYTRLLCMSQALQGVCIYLIILISFLPVHIYNMHIYTNLRISGGRLVSLNLIVLGGDRCVFEFVLDPIEKSDSCSYFHKSYSSNTNKLFSVSNFL